MATTNFERVAGELVGEQNTHRVNLKLTIIESWTDGSKRAAERTIEDIEPLSLAGVPDGKYTLRFPFNGKQEQHPVKIHFGYMLNGD